MTKLWQHSPDENEKSLDENSDFYEDEYGLDDKYTGFEKIPHKKFGEEESRPAKKRSSAKHQKRSDKE